MLGGFWRFYRDLNERSASGYEPGSDREAFMLGRATMFAEGGLKAFRTLGLWKVHTAAIGQMPWVPEEAPRCTTGEQPYGCELPRQIAIDDEAGTEAWLNSRLRGIPTSGYVDATSYVCDVDVCHPDLDGLPVYLDELHLDPAITEAFAPAYAGIFGDTTSRRRSATRTPRVRLRAPTRCRRQCRHRRRPRPRRRDRAPRPPLPEPGHAVEVPDRVLRQSPTPALHVGVDRHRSQAGGVAEVDE